MTTRRRKTSRLEAFAEKHIGKVTLISVSWAGLALAGLRSARAVGEAAGMLALATALAVALAVILAHLFQPRVYDRTESPPPPRDASGRRRAPAGASTRQPARRPAPASPRAGRAATPDLESFPTDATPEQLRAWLQAHGRSARLPQRIPPPAGP